MEIVYVWINKFDSRNLENLEFNLGSEYIYNFEFDASNKQALLSRRENENYVKNLYAPFLNVSAIVGENASGKSSLIEALRQILEERRNYIEYLILFQEDNIFYYNSFFGYKPDREGNIFDGRPRGIDVNIGFDGFEQTPISAPKRDYQTAFFSHIIDLSIYPMNHDSPLGVDVSSNWLCFDDMNKKPNDSNRPDLAYHKYGETLRQLKFSLYFNDNVDILKSINIPKEIEIYTDQLNYSWSSSIVFRNTPYGIRPYAQILSDKIDFEVSDSEDDKYRCLLYFLKDIIHCLYKNFERTNLYLTRNFKITVNEQEIFALSSIDAVMKFLESQDFFDGQPAIRLIKAVRQSIKNAVNVEAGPKISWTTAVSDETTELLNAYQSFIVSMKKFSDTPYGFMSFDWRNMSTGEKAYFNLFSRFYYAKELILEKISNQRFQAHEREEIPKTIYILIDEGEIGFHLQWQKEYVHKLLTVLPLILTFDTQTPNLQIIFTTHSPMSLSDIPQDRILYLKNGKRVEESMQSFGANIADLFKHSFFIHDGLVGNFAKEKINETITWLNDKENSTNAEFYKRLIQQIDEPIIKRKLIEMYSEKMQDDTDKDDTRQNIIRQITEFKHKFGEDVL